jgi:hypothetical protein
MREKLAELNRLLEEEEKEDVRSTVFDDGTSRG